MTPFKNDERLSEVLELFLLPNYNVVSTTYLDLLLTHISKNIKELNPSSSEYCEVFQKWVLRALDVWSNGCKPSQSITTFTLKLIGLIASNELHFHYWHCKDVYNKLYVLLELHKDDLPVSIKMAYTVMLSDLINHRSGRQWVIDSGIWKDIVKYAHWNHTMYVTRTSQKFLWTLLLHECQNTRICKEIILAVAAPLISSTFNAQVHQALEDNYLDQNKLLCTTLDLITSIFENTLFVDLDNTIPELCQDLIDLEMRVKALFEACISTKFLQHVNKLLVLSSIILKLRNAIKGGKEIIDMDEWQKCRSDLYYISMMLLSKKYVLELVKMNKISMIYWKKLQCLHPFVLPGQYKFEHQVIALMVLPLCACIKQNYVHHDLFELYVDKLFDVTCTAVQRLAYNVRDIIWKADLPVEQICKVSIDLLLEIADIMDRDVAVIAFQTLCHALKNFMPDMYNEDKKNASETNNTTNLDHQRKTVYRTILQGDPLIDKPVLLAALLNGLAVMTAKFKLKWQECVETICLLSLAQEILNHPGILPMICVKALNICKLAIQNFMPPNLVLLVDTDNHMNEIGPPLFKRLHDPNWEVRDSVLEVLNTIAIISEDKYPAFQEFLLTNDFPQLAVEITKTDGDSYVRASALTFISTTVRINKLWDGKLSQLDLPNVAIDLLKNESEGIVRREAAILIKELYVHRKWPRNVIDSMSRAMSIAAVFDLHWEVKKNALEFWKQFIKLHLADQGVLDGSFPKVTFSKEHRKIVCLNETEIKRRLNKALDELAKQSCLGILLVTLEDDSDFEVCKTSAAIIDKLKTFLLKYKLNEPLPALPLPKDSATIDSAYVKPPSNVSISDTETMLNDSCNVIDEIVDANDANLLASIYKNSLKMDGETKKTEEKTLEYISCVTRQSFLQTIFNSDIDDYIKEKSRWLTSYTNSFESVLDDILTMHKQEDVNLMDCY